jgi:hypothetical protein
MSYYLYTGRTDGRIKMWKDPIVDEVRKIRKEQAEKFKFDVRAIIADSRKRQNSTKRHIVSFASKQKE